MIILLINCYVFVAVLVSRGPVIVLCPLKGHTYLSKPIAFSIKMVETETLSAAFFCTNKYLQLLGRALQSFFFFSIGNWFYHFMRNFENWPNILFLKYVWPFFKVIYERLKKSLPQINFKLF